MSIQNLKEKAFKNSEVKTEYDLLESEFSLIDALLSMRKKSGLTQEEIAFLRCSDEHIILPLT
jgi:hypothetical protein